MPAHAEYLGEYFVFSSRMLEMLSFDWGERECLAVTVLVVIQELGPFL